MQVLKRKVDQSFLEEIGMPVTRAAKKTTCEETTIKEGQLSGQTETYVSSSCGSPKGICSPARPSYDLSVDGRTASLSDSAHNQPTDNSVHAKGCKITEGASPTAQPSAAQQAQQASLPAPGLRPIITRSASSGSHGLDSPRSYSRQSPKAPHLPPPLAIESPRRRTRSQEAVLPCSTQASPTAAQTEEAVLERQASGLSIEEDMGGASSSQAAAKGAAQKQARATAKQKTTPRSCLRRRHQQKPDGTSDFTQPVGRSSGLAAPAAAPVAASDPGPGSPRRSPRRRVRFAPGPLEQHYETPDGHPDHEGETARQRRALQVSYPVDLTPSSIKMLEVELGESYRPSIDRLKRRVGLLPRIPRPRRHVTAQKNAASKPAALPALRTLRVLRPRPAIAQDGSDSDEDGLDSPTSSSSTISDDWAEYLFGAPLRRSTRSTASTVGSPTAPPPTTAESPRAEWSASSGGVRHGAARSVAARSRKFAPSASRQPDCHSAQPGSPKSPQASHKQSQPQSGPPLHSQPSPQKRRAPCSEAADGSASDRHPRSPRRQRPLSSAPSAQPASSRQLSLFELPRHSSAVLAAHGEGEALTRRGTLRSACLSSAPASGAPHAPADTPMPPAQSGAEQRPASPVRALPPLAAWLRPGPQPALQLFCSPPSGATAADPGGPNPFSCCEDKRDLGVTRARPRKSTGGHWPRTSGSAPASATEKLSGGAEPPAGSQQRGYLAGEEGTPRAGVGGRERRAIGSLYDPLVPKFQPGLRRSSGGCWPPRNAPALPSHQ